MKIHSKTKFFVGIAILVLLIISYFIKISTEFGSNYETQDTLLGILIFHNPIILILYIIIDLALIFTSFKKIKFL